MPSPFIPLTETLRAVAQRYGLESKLTEHRLRRQWPAIVGEQVAHHTRPDAIRYKKLYLVADSSVWLQQLIFLKPSLVHKINQVAGTEIITDVVFRVGPVDTAPTTDTESAHRSAPQPDEAAIEQARAHATAIADPELRDHLSAVMARALSAPPPRPRGPVR
jgi:predicted nucleic acid-binding Zn ribbon protein